MPDDEPAWYLKVVDPEKMREARERAALSQNAAAQKAGVTLTTIQNWESGRRRNISRPFITAAARAYGVEPEDLVTDQAPGPFRVPKPAQPPGEAPDGRQLDEFQPGQSQRETRRSE